MKIRWTGLLLLALLVSGVAGATEKYVPEEGSAELAKHARREKIPLDPKLPNVLIIGDSISMGYTPYVAKLLRGKANVIHNPGNAQGTTYGRENLATWLGAKSWQVIHFNWGLHDLKHVKVVGGQKNSDDPKDPQQADLLTYETNLRALVEQLKATKAKLIFATTTPYPAGVSPFRAPEDAAQYNKVALRIMQANGIKLDDLYTLILPKLKELQRPRNVHFSDKGSEVLAQHVAESILQELGLPLDVSDKK
ncbi:MAG: SGNH/GDSL hydrolase family protein [Verrucomicrobia bacterium]|nr:MAG: SGNH/GDSL hydrolase family protein [Verrucomicrobiota bacterium]